MGAELVRKSLNEGETESARRSLKNESSYQPALAIIIRRAYHEGQASMANINSDSVVPMVLTAIYFAMRTTINDLIVKEHVQVLKLVFNCSLRYP